METKQQEATRILVVEDERIVARDIQATLRRLGYEVPALAASCDAALEKAAATRPHLVLQDINIEGDRDGIETATLLRAQFDVPVIFLTAYSDDATLERAKKALPAGFLLKPFEERELLAVIEMAFYKHAAEKELREKDVQLRHTQAHLSATLRSVGDGVIAVDPDGHITFINAAAQLLCGTVEAEAIGCKYSQVFHVKASNSGSLATMLESALREIRPVQALEDCVLVSQDGDERAIDFTIAPIRDEERDNVPVSGAVIVFRDVSERKILEHRLTHQAFHDPLTGLPNRALFSNRLRHALATSRRTNMPLAVLFIDMDNFKVVNDSLGHALGDLMLVEIGARMQRALRVSDTAARFGGDEFTVLIENGDNSIHTIALVERLLEVLQEPYDLNGQIVYSSPSIGVAFSNGSHHMVDELLRHADAAMYDAKRKGRACYAIYQKGMSETALQRLQLGNELREAMAKGELELHYQPKVTLAGDKVCGVEALVRWNHPVRGQVPPSVFVPIAEEMGLVVGIGKWVLREACAQAKRWQESGEYSLGTDSEDAMQINVNLSARQLQNADLASTVETILRETGLMPGTLTLEITESVVMEEAETNLQVMHDLKKLGVSLAIDDFGTGYSSLSYLRSFPIDFLKIDRRFIAGLKQDSGDWVIVRSMIELAHALNLGVVAEGAETLEEVDSLRALGCDMVQGYYFARSMPASECTKFLQAARASHSRGA